jgi:hypothetical protein
MDRNVPALERAFQLARSDRVGSASHIKEQLRREGYDNSAVEGPLLRSQLKALIELARSGTPGKW